MSVKDCDREIEKQDIPTSEEMIIMDVDPTREEIARFIESQLIKTSAEAFKAKRDKIHYGVYELKQLMDFIYSGKPSAKEEEIVYGVKS